MLNILIAVILILLIIILFIWVVRTLAFEDEEAYMLLHPSAYDTNLEPF